MKKLAFALALSLAATSAFAQAAIPQIGDNVTNLAPGGTAGVVAGQSVIIAGVGTATAVWIGGALILILVLSSGGSSSNTTTN